MMTRRGVIRAAVGAVLMLARLFFKGAVTISHDAAPLFWL